MVKQSKPMFDQVWGIDRYPQSIEFGNVVQEYLYLWRVPGSGLLEPQNLTGYLAHGTQVEVTEIVEQDGGNYAHVHTIVEHDGQEIINQGWILCRLLKTLGEQEDWGG